MTINERMREIGTMRTMGMAGAGITRLFILENVFLAMLFCLVGVAAALLVIGVFAFLVPLPPAGAVACSWTMPTSCWCRGRSTCSASWL